MNAATTVTIVLQTQSASTHEDHLSVSVREGTPWQMEFVKVTKTENKLWIAENYTKIVQCLVKVHAKINHLLFSLLDINECDSPNPCEVQHPENRDCVNTEGGVACPCKPGYTYNVTSGSCEGRILVNNKTNIFILVPPKRAKLRNNIILNAL